MAEPSVAKKPEVSQGSGAARRAPDAHAQGSGAPAAQRQYMAQLAQEQKGAQGAAPPTAGGARTPGQKQAALKKIKLGAVNDLDTGFSSKVGQIIDVVCPKAGDLTVLQVEANIPISAGVAVALTLEGEAERTKSGVRLRGDFRIGIQGKVDAAIIEVYAKVQGLGYCEAFGDTSSEAVRLMTWGFYQRVKGVSERAANFVWNKDKMAAVTRGMDEDDYAENGVGIAASVGMKRSSAVPGNLPKKAEGEVTATRGTRWQKGENGKLDAKETRALELEFASGPFKVVLEGSVVREGGKVKEWDVRLKFTGTVLLADAAIEKKVVEWLANIAMQAAQASRIGKALADGSTGQRIGAGFGLLGSSISGRYAGELVNQKLAQRVKSFGGARIALRGVIGVDSEGGAMRGMFKLARVQTMSVGGESSAISVVLQNSESVVSVSGIPLGKA